MSDRGLSGCDQIPRRVKLRRRRASLKCLGHDVKAPQCTRMPSHVVVYDEQRVTDPAVLSTAEGYDVPQDVAINVAIPRSLVVAMEETATMPEGYKEITLARSGDILSHGFRNACNEFQDQLQQRQMVGVLSEETKDQTVDGGVFRRWLIPSEDESSVYEQRSLGRRLLQGFAHPCFDQLYIMCLVLWSVAKAASGYLPSFDVEAVLPLVLVCMSLAAVIPIAAAICFRMFGPLVPDTASRQDKRFWGLFFILALRGIAIGPIRCVPLLRGLAGRRKTVKEQHTANGPVLRHYQKTKIDGTTMITWTCRVCCARNPAQPFRRVKTHMHHVKVVPFRDRHRIICDIFSHRDTNLCDRCKSPWDYRPRKCAEHLFGPEYEGPTRQRTHVQRRRSSKEAVRGALRELYVAVRMWTLGDRRMITTRDIVARIQDESHMYFLDYTLRALHASYLMPDVVRHEVKYAEGEEVECDSGQPYGLPAVIRRVHANATYDVMYAHGELARNALRSSIRGRPIYRQYAWVQVMCILVLVACTLFPLLGAARHTRLFAPLGWALSSMALLAMWYHCHRILKAHAPLRRRFERRLYWLWLLPYTLLWGFTTCALLRARAALSIAWSFIMVISYAFSLTLTAWLYIAKPVYGLLCGALSVPWILTQFALGLWLDGATRRLPLFVSFAPLWLFLLCLICSVQIVPYLWDGTLPRLSTVRTVAAARAQDHDTAEAIDETSFYAGQRDVEPSAGGTLEPGAQMPSAGYPDTRAATYNDFEKEQTEGYQPADEEYPRANRFSANAQQQQQDA